MSLKLKKNRYLLACSFGPDSMALFRMLLDGGYSFDVAHVNYHLRDESNQEEQSLRSYCKEKGINLFVYDNMNVPKSNIEAKCREIRYRFFKEVFDSGNYDALLVAHNQDDQIETYLMQKERKNLVKYYGIEKSTYLFGMRVLRPLLSYSKASLEEYCQQTKTPYCIDKTNLEPIYRRNMIRLNVVSKMSNEDRELIIREINGCNKDLKHIYNNIRNIDNNIDNLMKLSDLEFAYYINAQIKKINLSYKITYKQTLEIVKILRSNKPNIFMTCEQGKVIIEKTYDKLFVRPNKDIKGYQFIIKKRQVIDNKFFYADLLSDTASRNIFDKDFPLTIRTFRKGDTYLIKDYHVQVRRLFIDWKMPSLLRKVWPLVVNKDGKIIYIPRYRKDFVVDETLNFYVKECFTLK